MAQDFEDGKPVEDYVAELNEIVLKPKPAPKIEVAVAKPILKVESIPKKPEEKAVPKIEEPTPIPTPVEVTPQVPVEPVVEKRPSFDDVLSHAIKTKQNQIDEEARKKKVEVVDRVYDKLGKLIDMAVSDAPVPIPQMDPPRDVIRQVVEEVWAEKSTQQYVSPVSSKVVKKKKKFKHWYSLHADPNL